MVERLPADRSIAEPASVNDVEAMVTALRQCGASRFDPARFALIEGLARRLPCLSEAVRPPVEGKLTGLLIDYRERYERVRSETRDTLKRLAEKYPEASSELQSLAEAGDTIGLRRWVARRERQAQVTPLAELVRQLAPSLPNIGSTGSASRGGVAGEQAAGADADELKSLRYFRDTWAKLSVEQQLVQALADGPENAGPLNSHLLVLQALKRLRDLSPSYLNRFMTYVDALLWLDQAAAGPVPRKYLAGGEGDKRRKPTRARVRSG